MRKEPRHGRSRTKKLLDLTRAACGRGGEVPVLSANEAVWELLRIGHRQWRCGAFGPIGLDYGALFEMARALGIPIDRSLLEKIALYEDEILRSRDGKESTGVCDEDKARECRERLGEFFEAACRKCDLKPAKTG